VTLFTVVFRKKRNGDYDVAIQPTTSASRRKGHRWTDTSAADDEVAKRLVAMARALC
jgi:hypothetical protein